MPDSPTSLTEAAARAHHDEYERLAPIYRYETRKQTRVPWEELPESMRLLMIDSERAALAAAKVPELLAVVEAASAILRPARGDASWMQTAEFDDLRAALTHYDDA